MIAVGAVSNETLLARSMPWPIKPITASNPTINAIMENTTIIETTPAIKGMNSANIINEKNMNARNRSGLLVNKSYLGNVTRKLLSKQTSK